MEQPVSSGESYAGYSLVPLSLPAWYISLVIPAYTMHNMQWEGSELAQLSFFPFLLGGSIYNGTQHYKVGCFEVLSLEKTGGWGAQNPTPLQGIFWTLLHTGDRILTNKPHFLRDTLVMKRNTLWHSRGISAMQLLANLTLSTRIRSRQNCTKLTNQYRDFCLEHL